MSFCPVGSLCSPGCDSGSAGAVWQGAGLHDPSVSTPGDVAGSSSTKMHGRRKQGGLQYRGQLVRSADVQHVSVGVLALGSADGCLEDGSQQEMQ